MAVPDMSYTHNCTLAQYYQNQRATSVSAAYLSSSNLLASASSLSFSILSRSSFSSSSLQTGGQTVIRRSLRSYKAITSNSKLKTICSHLFRLSRLISNLFFSISAFFSSLRASYSSSSISCRRCFSTSSSSFCLASTKQHAGQQMLKIATSFNKLSSLKQT